MLHIPAPHITGLSLVKDREWAGLCACMSVYTLIVYTLNLLSFLLHAHDFACTYTDKVVCLQHRECASKVCLPSCLEWYISVCMNACVIVRACSCALLCMRLLPTAACLLGFSVTWPLLRKTRGSSSAEENDHISHSQVFLNFSTCTWETFSLQRCY